MTTTFKTLAFAAMMVIGTTTGFANNHNTRINRPAPAPAAVVHAPHHRHNCNCRVCEEMRFRMEMERLHRETRGPVHGCSCPKCEDMRHHHSAPHPKNGLHNRVHR